jgi:hypothetical protein
MANTTTIILTPVAKTFAQQMVDSLQAALLSNPSGVVSINVDGISTTYTNRNDLLNELNRWQRIVARENSKRPIAMGINLGSF